MVLRKPSYRVIQIPCEWTRTGFPCREYGQESICHSSGDPARISMGRERSVTPRRGGNVFPTGSHRYQIQNFHVKDGIPVLECGTFGDHILPPSVFRLAIM